MRDRSGEHFPKVREMIQESLTNLGDGNPIDEKSVDNLASLVHVSMTTPHRVYHTVTHALDVAAPMTCQRHPIAILAALFHDIVYITVDKTILPEQEAFIGDMISFDESGRFTIEVPQKEDWDFAVELVDAMFGPLRSTFPGMNCNEYLSAVFTARVMQQILSMKDLVALIACIEASIPFRANLEDGTTPMQALMKRIARMKEKLLSGRKDGYLSPSGANGTSNLQLSKLDMVSIVQQAAFFANCDLGSFSSRDISRFLDDSWSLLPEWWPPLLDSKPKVRDTYDAICLLTQRYKTIPLDRLFQSFENVPSQSEMEEKFAQAKYNMNIAGVYAHVRLFEVGTVLQAMEAAFGSTDGAVGEGVNSKVMQLGGSAEFWSQFCKSSFSHMGGEGHEEIISKEYSAVHRMLASGRRTGYSWDPAHSPWAVCMCRELGYDFVITSSKSISARAQADVLGASKTWLDMLPPVLLQKLSVILSDIFPEDSQAVQQIRFKTRRRRASLYFV